MIKASPPSIQLTTFGAKQAISVIMACTSLGKEDFVSSVSNSMCLTDLLGFVGRLFDDDAIALLRWVSLEACLKTRTVVVLVVSWHSLHASLPFWVPILPCLHLSGK
jgi:hypothetical protein